MTPIPTSTPEPILTPTPRHNSNDENRVSAVRNGNSVEIALSLAETVKDEDILLFVAIKENGVLKAVFLPELTDMSAQVVVPGEIAGGDITVYVWDKNHKPYTNPTKIQR